MLEDLGVAFASRDCGHVRALDSIDGDRRGFGNHALMLCGAHASVDVEAFWAHPSTYEHDHKAFDNCCVERGG